MQRLFSTFPEGLPGVGLVLLRAAVAVPVLQQTIAGLQTAPPLGLVRAGSALLLMVGLWTPVAGLAVATAELVLAFLHPAERWVGVHFATMGLAVALLGPGAWSIDARLFGRKHIQIP